MSANYRNSAATEKVMQPDWIQRNQCLWRRTSMSSAAACPLICKMLKRIRSLLKAIYTISLRDLSMSVIISTFVHSLIETCSASDCVTLQWIGRQQGTSIYTYTPIMHCSPTPGLPVIQLQHYNHFIADTQALQC